MEKGYTRVEDMWCLANCLQEVMGRHSATRTAMNTHYDSHFFEKDMLMRCLGQSIEFTPPRLVSFGCFTFYNSTKRSGVIRAHHIHRKEYFRKEPSWESSAGGNRSSTLPRRCISPIRTKSRVKLSSAHIAATTNSIRPRHYSTHLV